ncbi:MAG: spermidine synthase [Arenicella sp.]|jgi:spermidine synthase
MNINALGVFFIALASLLLELVLLRVFDVLWYPNMSYMVITLAVFSFGLAGVYLSLRPITLSDKTWRIMAGLTVVMAVCVLFLRPAIDALPFNYHMLTGDQTTKTAINFVLLYVVICVPFFLTGLVLSLVFSHFAAQIRELYFWDLVGAAFGSVLLIPLLPGLGTAGILYVVAGLAFISALCFSYRHSRILAGVLGVLAIVCIAYPFTQSSIETFKPHMMKRGFKALEPNLGEGTWWDPISKIDVLNLEPLKQKRKWIAYDGGSQSSYLYPFDGDFEALRKSLPESANEHFWGSYVAVSHFLKADTDARVLIIGSAGGQELKAALTYSPSEVDAIELVGKVVELGKNKYAEYTGNIMNDPRANVIKGEGRSFLRGSGKTYDIIQMFSNHTSSSIAAGSGSMQANYLQTVEAYKEYFSHLSDDGVLHINHHIYPKMVATASRAWAELGRTDFRSHIIVSEYPGGQDNLPTTLIKMSPWTAAEVQKVKSFTPKTHVFPVDPMRPKNSFLPDEFFVGKLPNSVLDAVPYRIEEPTDNQPFFNSLRISLDSLPKTAPDQFVNESVSGLLNSQKKTGYPVDVMHLFVTAGAAIVFALVFTLGPLLFARTGREKWQGKRSFMAYFCALGMGFIVFELVSIQIFMKLIGYPLYTYTTVLFTFLFGAGIGSLCSEKLAIFEKKRTMLPFVGIALSAAFLILSQQFLFDPLLQLGTIGRIFSSFVLIFPLAFFLGMPFPLGVLAIEHRPQGTIAWAWALNGLFTVTGGIFCAIFSVYFGFMATMMVAVLAYIIAGLSYRGMTSAMHVGQ